MKFSSIFQYFNYQILFPKNLISKKLMKIKQLIYEQDRSTCEESPLMVVFVTSGHTAASCLVNPVLISCIDSDYLVL